MSNYSHRGYEHRTAGYGRRRHKASGFKKKSNGSGFIGALAVTAIIIVIAALVFLFVKYYKPFINSFNDTGTEIVQTADTPTESPDTPQGAFDVANNKIFVSNGCGCLMFKGIDDTAANYAAVLNGIATSLSDEIKIYSMVIPNHTEFIFGDDFSKYTNSQRQNLNKISLALMDKITNANPYEILNQHSGEYIYYRTDEGVTSLGAYYLYRAFAQTAGISSDELYSLETLSENKGSAGRFEGSFIKATVDTYLQPHGNQVLFENADIVEFFRPAVDYSCYSVNPKTDEGQETNIFSTENAKGNPLSVFPANNAPMLRIYRSGETDDTNLLIVKDYIAEPLIGYLIPHYSEIHVADAQLYKENLSEYILKHEITQILIVNGISNANNSLYCQRLRDLFDSSVSG